MAQLLAVKGESFLVSFLILQFRLPNYSGCRGSHDPRMGIGMLHIIMRIDHSAQNGMKKVQSVI